MTYIWLEYNSLSNATWHILYHGRAEHIPLSSYHHRAGTILIGWQTGFFHFTLHIPAQIE